MKAQLSKNSTAAFFDVDGTLWEGNVVRHYVDLIRRDSRSMAQQMTIAKILFQVPYYLLVDRFSRSHFNRIFYRNYRQMSVADCHHWSQQYFQEVGDDRLFPAARECVLKHQQQGHLVILVTGSPSFIISPMAEFLGVDGTIATDLEAIDGCYTGKIIGLPLAGEEKARSMRRLSEQLGIDLDRSYAYGDSIADLPMLSAVGNPIAVNPSRTLRKVAQKKEWPIQQWKF